MLHETRNCQNCHNDFTIEPDNFNFYKKIDVPPPTWCPECRMVRRFMWRNEHNLYRKKDALTGREIFSSFPESAPCKIYELSYWNSDKWDPQKYARDYDFSRPFFQQFKEFLYEVPWPAHSVQRMVNSDYCGNAGGFKNCYLCFNGDDFENCAYVIVGYLTRDSFDLYNARHTELSYEGYMIDESYKVLYSVNCEECHDVWFSRNLMGCSNCFGCVNLRNKSYHLFNKPVTREQYQEFLKNFNSGSHQAVEEMRKKTEELWARAPMKYALLINTTNTTGEHIERSKNLKNCYNVHEGENLAYCQFLAPPVADCWDYTAWGAGASQIYESLTVGEECDSVKFSWECWPSSHNIEYSAHCRSSSNLFGCVGLQKKEYCIFNKQYSKEEYQTLRDKIVDQMKGDGEYGEFFPPELSPFAYNETIAQDFFPLTREQAETKGYLWREPEVKEFKTTVSSSDLPDDIKDTPESIVNEIIKCGQCGKAYRIIQIEFNFLKNMKLPLPRLCVSCRFARRFKFVNPPKLWERKCDKCDKNVATSYAPDRPEIIYCEPCYNAEVV